MEERFLGLASAVIENVFICLYQGTLVLLERRWGKACTWNRRIFLQMLSLQKKAKPLRAEEQCLSPWTWARLEVQIQARGREWRLHPCAAWLVWDDVRPVRHTGVFGTGWV